MHSLQAQFFPDLKEFCVAAADKHHKAVIVAGLDGDFRREAFGQILSLVPHADVVTKKVGRCQRCQLPSLFSLRTVAGASSLFTPQHLECDSRGWATDTRTELVGGSEAYLPACRTCYNRLHATRSSDAAQPQVAR
jgi:thymidine kinase